MIMSRRGCSDGVARNMIALSIRAGKLVPHNVTLRYGRFRFLRLFDPDEVNRWLDSAKQYKPAKDGDKRKKENKKQK